MRFFFRFTCVFFLYIHIFRSISQAVHVLWSDCKNYQVHGMQVRCKCGRVMGAFDNTSPIYIFRLFNVRKVKFVPKPGTSEAEGLFDMLEVARFKFDFPLPEVIRYIRTLSYDDIQNQFYVRRVTIGTKKITFYDELNLNIVPLEIPSLEKFPLNLYIPRTSEQNASQNENNLCENIAIPSTSKQFTFQDVNNACNFASPSTSKQNISQEKNVFDRKSVIQGTSINLTNENNSNHDENVDQNETSSSFSTDQSMMSLNENSYEADMSVSSTASDLYSNVATPRCVLTPYLQDLENREQNNFGVPDINGNYFDDGQLLINQLPENENFDVNAILNEPLLPVEEEPVAEQQVVDESVLLNANLDVAQARNDLDQYLFEETDNILDLAINDLISNISPLNISPPDLIDFDFDF